MHFLKRFILSFGLLLCVGLLHAEGLAVVQGLEGTLLRKTARPALDIVAQASRSANATLYNSLSGLFQPQTFIPEPPISGLPQNDIPTTFRVQLGPNAHQTASAFAIKYNDDILGVTAGHVMKNIEQQPYLKYQVAPGTFKSVLISSWRRGNPNNIDVAVFKIPSEARPFIKAISLLEQPLETNQPVSILGFSQNKLLWYPREEVLYIGPQRVLVRSSSVEPALGMCGSPVMVNKQVAGLYVGFTNELKDAPKWSRLLAPVSTEQLPALHQIIPIAQIIPFAQSLLNDTPQATGTMLRVMGYPITLLYAEDYLYSLEVIRNNESVQSIYTGPLADPTHLENFLNIQANDVVRVTIVRKDNTVHVYDVDVSSGEVIPYM